MNNCPTKLDGKEPLVKAGGWFMREPIPYIVKGGMKSMETRW